MKLELLSMLFIVALIFSGSFFFYDVTKAKSERDIICEDLGYEKHTDFIGVLTMKIPSYIECDYEHRYKRVCEQAIDKWGRNSTERDCKYISIEEEQ